MKKTKGLIRQSIKKITFLIHRILEDNVGIYAAQASFFILISSIPFVMLLLTLAQFVIPLSKAEVITVISNNIPSAMSTFLISIINELFNKSTISLVSVTAVTTLWSASRGIMALLQGLDNIYDTNVRGYIRERITSFFYTLVFILAILLTFIVIVLGNKLELLISDHFPLLDVIVNHILRARTLMFLVFLSLFFTLVYTLLPGLRVKFLYQLPGGVFSAAGWLIFSYGYALYINHFSNYSYLYGSLTAIVLMMLWLYFCMNIFLWGAELNQIMRERRTELSIPDAAKELKTKQNTSKRK